VCFSTLLAWLGMRKLLAVVSFILASYCLLLSIVGLSRSYVAHTYGNLHGLSSHGYASAALAFMVVAGILLWIGFKLWQTASSCEDKNQTPVANGPTNIRRAAFLVQPERVVANPDITQSLTKIWVQLGSNNCRKPCIWT